MKRKISVWSVPVFVTALLILGCLAFCFGRMQQPDNMAVHLTSAGDGAAFLLRQGKRVKMPPLTVKNIFIPSADDSMIWQEYLNMQDGQRLPLRHCSGGKATLLQYETEEGDTVISLLISEGTLIAADQTSFDIFPQCRPLF